MTEQQLLIISTSFLVAILLVWTQAWWKTLSIYSKAAKPAPTIMVETMLISIYITILICLAGLLLAFYDLSAHAKIYFYIALGMTALQVFLTLVSVIIRGLGGTPTRPTFESQITRIHRYCWFSFVSVISLICLWTIIVDLVIVMTK